MKTEFQVTYFVWMARKDKQGNYPVYIRSKQNSSKQISYYTGQKVLKSDLKEIKKVDKKGNKKTTYVLKNKTAKILELERKLKATYKDLLAQGEEPTLELLLQHLNDVKKPSDRGIVAWCDDYLNSPYSEGQKKAVRTLRTNLAGKKRGEKEIEGFSPSLTFDKLNKPKLKAFFEFLTKQGVANNSQYKRLRALINVAQHADIDIPDLNKYELPYSTANALKARLSWKEVKAVINTETISPLEQIAKDVFLLACFSGLRISDLLTLHQGKLHDFHYERIQTKTKLPVLVTVHKFNQELFQKFIQTGVKFTRQRLSDGLKEVLERSGLTETVTKIRAVGTDYKPVQKPKYQEISFHSGRRFYARLLNDLGLGNEIARDELGHGYKSVTELYAGSQDHRLRASRVRKAIDTMEEKLEELESFMKVA